MKRRSTRLTVSKKMKQKMKTTCAASISILLVLSLAGLSAAAAGSDDAIRLPSDGKGLADLLTAMARTAHGKKEQRPWECCDLALCTRSYPPICRCLDKVDRCSNACEKCEETEEDSRYVCADLYHGFPGPTCNPDAGLVDLKLAFAGRKRERNEARPWKCCDQQICTRSFPPICHCWDEVEQCDNACKRCEEVEGNGRYRCLDSHRGDPAPPCDDRKHGMRRAVDAVLRGYGY